MGIELINQKKISCHIGSWNNLNFFFEKNKIIVGHFYEFVLMTKYFTVVFAKPLFYVHKLL